MLFEYGREVEEAVAKWLGTTPASIEDDVKTLTEWCKSQSHFPEIPDRKLLRAFLVLHKLSKEMTKKAIDSYYTVRTKFPEVFQNSNPKLPHMQALFDIGYGVITKNLTDDLDKIIFFKMKRPDLCENINVFHALAMVLNVTELRLWKEYRCQDILVLDVDGINLLHLSLITPKFVITCRYINKKIFNHRMKATYIVNAPSFYVTFLKAVLSPKVFDRLHIFPDCNILKETIPEKLLPKDYGGLGESLEQLQDMLVKEMELFQYRYDRLDELKVDESLRPDPLENDDLLGFYGNFKRLNFD